MPDIFTRIDKAMTVANEKIKDYSDYRQQLFEFKELCKDEKVKRALYLYDVILGRQNA